MKDAGSKEGDMLSGGSVFRQVLRLIADFPCAMTAEKVYGMDFSVVYMDKM